MYDCLLIDNGITLPLLVYVLLELEALKSRFVVTQLPKAPTVGPPCEVLEKQPSPLKKVPFPVPRLLSIFPVMLGNRKKHSIECFFIL